MPMYNLSPCSVLRMQQSVRQTRMSELTKLLSVLLLFMFYLSFETNKKAGLNGNLVSSEQNLYYSVHARIVQLLLHGP